MSLTHIQFCYIALSSIMSWLQFENIRTLLAIVLKHQIDYCQAK